jgi:RNase P protein component
MVPKAYRLTQSEIRAVLQKGKRQAGPSFSKIQLNGRPGYAILTPKSDFPTAVARNRAQRLFGARIHPSKSSTCTQSTVFILKRTPQIYLPSQEEIGSL